jgi:hypothetical protein
VCAKSTVPYAKQLVHTKTTLNFADRTPGAMTKERGGETIHWISNGQLQLHTNNQGMADIKAFKSLYSKADIFDVQKSSVVAQRNI